MEDAGALDQHTRLYNLVRHRVLRPGLYRKQDGMVVFDPISAQDYEDRIESNEFESLAFHSWSMRRGIFTVGRDGELVNFKGVDCRAVADDVKTCDISSILGRAQKRHEIVITYFEHGSYQGHKKNPQIRVRGASQLHDLIGEHDKLAKYYGSSVLRIPPIVDIQAFPEEFCLRYNLPLHSEVWEEFLTGLRVSDEKDMTRGNFGKLRIPGLVRMQEVGVPHSTRFQTWAEYFSTLPPTELSILSQIPGFQAAVLEEDGRYSLGAAFGQATRILENPFRISDLAHYVETRDVDSVKLILDYSRHNCHDSFLLSYATTMGRNAAGLMNEGLANHLWSHRQDFGLSGEMCDEAINDVTQNLTRDDCEEAGFYGGGDRANDLVSSIVTDKVKFYSQVYLLASNMKVIEDALRLVGYEVADRYEDAFICQFLALLQDREATIAAVLSWGDRLFGESGELPQYLGVRAKNTMRGFEQYVSDFTGRLETIGSSWR